VRLTPCALKGEPNKENCAASSFTIPPAVITLNAGSSTELDGICPLGMSGLLEVARGQIEFVMYDPTAEGNLNEKQMLTPKLGSNPSSLHKFSYSDKPFDQLKTVNVMGKKKQLLKKEIYIYKYIYLKRERERRRV
jgi:hypothetical protein